MFDKRQYHKEYMRKYREEVIKQSPEKLARVKEMDKLHDAKQRQDPEWREKRRKIAREYMKNKRNDDPEFKKLCYKKHAEWAKKNKDHVNIKQRERNKRPSNKLKARKRILKKKYGLTYEEYESKVNNQNSKCPICKNIMSNAHVDHNHVTGQIRDLLCSFCNIWIGFIEKYPHLIKPMLKYLKKWENEGEIAQKEITKKEIA